MLTELFNTLLPYLLPTGVLGSLVAWLFKRDAHRANAAREAADAHKQMYDNLKLSVDEIQNENKLLNAAVRRLESLLFRAPRCPYYSKCPLRNGLQHYTQQLEAAEQRSDYAGYQREANGQHLPRDTNLEQRAGESRHDEPDPLDAEPP